METSADKLVSVYLKIRTAIQDKDQEIKRISKSNRIKLVMNSSSFASRKKQMGLRLLLEQCPAVLFLATGQVIGNVCMRSLKNRCPTPLAREKNTQREHERVFS